MKNLNALFDKPTRARRASRRGLSWRAKIACACVGAALLALFFSPPRPPEPRVHLAARSWGHSPFDLAAPSAAEASSREGLGAARAGAAACDDSFAAILDRARPYVKPPAGVSDRKYLQQRALQSLEAAASLMLCEAPTSANVASALDVESQSHELWDLSAIYLRIARDSADARQDGLASSASPGFCDPSDSQVCGFALERPEALLDLEPDAGSAPSLRSVASPMLEASAAHGASRWLKALNEPARGPSPFSSS